MNEFIIYSVYPDSNSIYEDAWGYYLELDGKIIAEYGDYYHDKGLEKAKGFIDGYACAKNWKEKVDYIIRRDKKIDKNLG